MVREGGGAGPATLRRFSLDSGLDERSSSERLRFARFGGSDGPIEDILEVVKWTSVSTWCVSEPESCN